MAEHIRHARNLSLPYWDDRLPFPLPDSACAALCRGHAVRWEGSIDDLAKLPARYELIDGWLLLTR